jgi:hypothetical protein
MIPYQLFAQQPTSLAEQKYPDGFYSIHYGTITVEGSGIATTKKEITVDGTSVIYVLNDIADPEYIANVTLTAGVTNLVAHNLGTTFRTWSVLDAQGAAMVYRDTASAADLSLYVPLLTSATIVCDIMVYK